MGLFQKKIEPRCTYCARGRALSEDQVICDRKGAAEGNPWLFAQAKAALAGEPEPDEPTVEERIGAQLTVTERTGMARYTYPEGDEFGTVIIGAGIAATPIEQAAVVVTGPSSCEGYAEGGNFCGIRTPYKIYFVAEFDVPAAETGIWKDDTLTPGGRFAEGSTSGVYFTFDLGKSRNVQYQIGRASCRERV